jgi:exosortase/archaeosortase family protein
MGFRSATRRALFMAACCVVPVLANGARAWGTIYVAQSQGIAFAAGFDHIVYGWIFFALVMAAVLGIAWRFFDRPVDDRLADVEAFERSPTLATLSRFEIGAWRVLAAMLLAAVAAALFGVALVRPLADGLLAAAGLHP